MLQHEFEVLYGKEVGADEYEVINGLYMLNNNETKEEFVARYKKMSKADLMRDVVAANQKSKEYDRNLRKEKEGAVARAMQAERENVKLRKILDGEREARGMLSSKFKEDYEKLEGQYRDFVKTIAVQCHDYDESFIEGECCRALGAKEYFTTLRDAGCTPSRNDLDMMIKYMEEDR